MTIQPVLFPLNIGTATELRVYVLEHTEKDNTVNVHYHFADLSQITVLANGGTLPYKVLHGNNIILSGQDYLDYKADETSVEAKIVALTGVTPVVA
jgi:hypothetical protein